MLVQTRKAGEKIRLSKGGVSFDLLVCSVDRGKVRLGIEDREVEVKRIEGPVRERVEA